MMKMAALVPKVSILLPSSTLIHHRRLPPLALPFPGRPLSHRSFTTSRVSDASTGAALPAPSSSPSSEVEGAGLSEEEALREAGNSLDIRVGRIRIAYPHPEADSLYVEEVDVGEAEPRIICSGLVDYIPINQLQNLNVVVVANLKPRNMRGVRSYGMLMAASDADHANVELLLPPQGSLPGHRIWFGSADDKPALPHPASPNQVQKKKIWELVQPHLKTDESGVAALGQYTMRTDEGAVVASTLKNARIS